MSDAIYGYCKECKMEMTYRDRHHGPPSICEACFILEMNYDYYKHSNDYNYVSILTLWAMEGNENERRKLALDTGE